jgi:hypothetical protein
MIAMTPTLTWSRGVARPCVLGAVLWMASGGAWCQVVPRALSTDALSKAPPPAAARSVVFDSGKADDLRLRQQPAYVESITVEGRDPDGPRTKRKSLEQSFAEALLAPPPSAAAAMRGLRSTPCYAIQSSLNTIGDSYAPLTGCPGYSNTP